MLLWNVDDDDAVGAIGVIGGLLDMDDDGGSMMGFYVIVVKF